MWQKIKKKNPNKTNHESVPLSLRIAKYNSTIAFSTGNLMACWPYASGVLLHTEEGRVFCDFSGKAESISDSKAQVDKSTSSPYFLVFLS